MPKQTINTFSNIGPYSVNKVFCEEGTINKNSSKEVSFFDKFVSKKKIGGYAKTNDGMGRE